MGLKQIIRASIRPILRSILSPSAPSSGDLFPSGPQPLHGPWEEGWALDVHSYSVTSSWHLTETGQLVHKYKYHGRIDLADRLADRAITLIEQHPTLKAIDGIVTVPPSVQRFYDPVGLLGQVLARRLGVPLLSGVLRKIRTTDLQKDMRTRAQKRANVAGAFAVRGNVQGKSLLILDDLYDSGETLKEVMRVLKRARALSIKVLTLTHTQHAHL